MSREESDWREVESCEECGVKFGRLKEEGVRVTIPRDYLLICQVCMDGYHYGEDL